MISYKKGGLLKRYSPTTPSQRGLIRLSRNDIWKGRPYKPLTKGLTKTGGRNNLGRITSRHIGGGHKRLYRIIDFKRSSNVTATVERIEYDPNRTSYIALIRSEGDLYSYILAPSDLSIGDKVESGSTVDIKSGNSLPLSSIPIGSVVHNIELKPGKGGQIVRSAGTFATVIGKDSGYAQVRLASGEMRLIHLKCMATIGALSNPNQKNTNIGKAGRNRWLGRRPKVRGVAMNPIDHPHGGGNGKTSGGRHPVTPWGKPTKGKKTRNKRKFTSKFIIQKRRR